MAQIKIYGQNEALFHFVTAHQHAIHNMQRALTSANTVNDVFVMDVEGEAYPQLVAVDGKGVKLAHIVLSNEVVSGEAQALVYLDSPDFLVAGVMTH
jgi:hypothetical protein